MRKMDNKGFYPLYTTLGVLVLVIVAGISLQWGTQAEQEFVSHVDRLQYLKLNHAVEDVKTAAVNAVKDSLYDALMDIGKIKGGTVNRFINGSLEGGWDMIVAEVRSRTQAHFHTHIEKAADYYDGNRAYFYFDDGMNLTLTELDAAMITFDFVGDEDQFMDAVVPLPSIITSRYGEWKGEEGASEVRIPLNIRLRDMYERAWHFHHDLRSNAEWALTIALYARAYARAYGLMGGSETGRAFLKVAHYSFDPISVLLYGNIASVKEFIAHPLDLVDIGAVPAALWYTEWLDLSEPSFVPPGIDLSGSDVGKAQDLITSNYDMVSIQEGVCDDFSGEEKYQCESLYEDDRLEEVYNSAKDKWDEVKDAFDDVEDLLEDYAYILEEYDEEYDECRDDGDDCSEDRESCEDRCDEDEDYCDDRCDAKYEWCEASSSRDYCHMEALDDVFSISCERFRDDAIDAITAIVDMLGDEDPGVTEQAEREYVGEVGSHPGSPEDGFEENKNETGLPETDELIEETIESKDELEDMLADLERMPLPVCGHDEDDCEFDSDCVKWDCDPTPSCRGPSCRSGNDYYECVADLKTGSRTKTCTVYTDDDEYEADKTISQCGCRCYPDLGLVEELKETLELVYDGLKQTEKTLREQKDALWKQLEAHRKSDELKARVADLRGGDSSYDVLSRLDVKYVKYDTGWKGWEQYVPGGFMQRNEGVCGDSMESVVLYTAQIAAASLATFFSCGLASPLLQYAIDFFPLIIESEVSFELTETLVDDGNRMILTNLASTGDRLGEPGDGRLFTYAPFEFEIYKKHKFNLGSVSGNRVIVYLYLPAVEGHINRAIEGLSSCSGEACE